MPARTAKSTRNWTRSNARMSCGDPARDLLSDRFWPEADMALAGVARSNVRFRPKADIARVHLSDVEASRFLRTIAVTINP